VTIPTAARGRRPYASYLAIGISAGFVAAPPAFAAPDSTTDRPFTAYVADQYLYDSNLFRIPALFASSPGISRQDHVNTISVGGDGQMSLGRQVFTAQLHASNSRFAQNSDLNNTAGQARLDWDWTLSPFLFGDAGGDFNRTLAGFANAHFFQRDLIDTTGYFVDARVRLAQHWSINAGVRNADTTHSLSIREIDNYRSKSGNLSLEYLTDEQNSIALEYRYTHAHFTQTITVNGVPFDPNYDDHDARVVVKYDLTGKLRLDASAGYLDRKYPNAQFGSFSGDVWKGTLNWQLTGKTTIAFGAWRQLSAYLGSESDYFVARGESIAPTWHATERIDVSLSASWSKQDYLSSSPSTLEFASRRDNVRNQQIRIAYAPRDYLQLEAAYSLEQRYSNQYDFSYNDKLWTGTFKFVF
jgi:hypothetical protein